MTTTPNPSALDLLERELEDALKLAKRAVEEHAKCEREERAAARITTALCEAYTEGKLTK